MSDAICPDCDSPLLPGHACTTGPPGVLVLPVPPTEADTGRRWVKLRECADMIEAELVAGFLASGGLHVTVESRTFRQEPMPLQRSFSRVVLWVPEGEASEARRVLEESAEAATTCTVCGGPMDDAVCPACAVAEPPRD